MSPAATRVLNAPRTAIEQRIDAIDPAALSAPLDAGGFTVVERMLDQQTCEELAELYDASDADEVAHFERFRSRVVMSRHGYGRGEYQYFAYPLPEVVATLRSALYPLLAPIANRWHEAAGNAVRFPDSLATFLARCHEAQQTRPTPLLLKYGIDDYNCLHQDLYGEHVFPLQVAILLSRPAEDFTGGEFVLTEQRPRMQSRVEVVPLAQGDAVIFAVNERPVRGTRGVYRVKMRHGVSRIRSGHRMTAGIIFHDAR